MNLSTIAKGSNDPNGEPILLGCVTLVRMIATGEIQNRITNGSGRAVGKVERAKPLSQARRKKIAKVSAEAKWS